ncbi:MAG: hypothetical protein AAF587_20110 [Bacteroidota bacterium]
MEHPNYNTAYIDQYLSGKLTQEDAFAFEQAIELLPDLEEEVRLQILAKGASFKAGRDIWRTNRREELTRWLGQHPECFLPSWIQYAAGIVLLISIGLALLPFRTQSPQHLEVSAVAYHMDPAPIIRTARAPSALHTSYQAFNSRQYARALQIWERLPLPQDSFTRNEIAYFKGLSYLELGQIDLARKSFLTVSEPTYYPRAQWNLAISWIKEGQQVQAIPVLESLSQQETSFQTKADRLLDMIQD